MWIPVLCVLILQVKASPRHQASQRVSSGCFHVLGIPTVDLSCPHGSVIRVDEVFYGAPPNNASCEYSAEENHCIQVEDLHEHCNGRHMCSAYVSNPFLVNCRTYANYMQINYTCVAAQSMKNICHGHVFNSKFHQIRSPKYPFDDYPANMHCACLLKTPDPGLRLRVLDFAVNSTESNPDHCQGDFLRITGHGKKCGQTEAQKIPERIFIAQGRATLEFWSNNEQETRGFWLEVRGSAYSKVQMLCGPVKKRRTPNTSIEMSEILSDTTTESLVTTEMTNAFDHPARSMRIDEAPGFEEHSNIPPSVASSTAQDTLSFITYSVEHRTQGMEEILQESENHFEAAEERLQEEREDFEDSSFEFNHNIGEVQIISGITVGVLILIAIIIIIVLVFKR